MNTPWFVRTNLVQRICSALLLALLLAFAQRSAGGSKLQDVSGQFTLSNYSLAAGSGTWTSGGSYALSSALGQHDSGTASGGGYTLLGGNLAGTGEAGSKIYLPLVTRH